MSRNDRCWLAFVVWSGLGYAFGLKLLMLMGLLAAVALVGEDFAAAYQRGRSRRIRRRDRVGGHDE